MSASFSHSMRLDARPSRASIASFDRDRAGPTQTGCRLYALMLGLCLSLLLSTLETTTVSTALVSITNELGGFSQRDWIVTSYLLTYTGFLTIFAKFSALFGCKVLLLLSLFLFMVFSLLCGASKNITMLIVFRSFQGVGGSGIYSLVSIITVQVIPAVQLGKYGAIISSTFALASILGPFLGGAITNNPRDWPWVFYLNGRLAVIALCLVVSFLPSSEADRDTLGVFRKGLPKRTLGRVDLIGAILLLSATILLVFVLEEAGTRIAWTSATTIVCLTLSGLLWIAFPLWEVLVLERSGTITEPMFPMTLLRARMITGMLIYAFLSGLPFMGVVVNLPQRFQAVDSVSPLTSGIWMLPLLISSPVGTALCGFLTSKFDVPLSYMVIAGASLQLLGIGLLISVPSTPLIIHEQQFGFEVIVGLGFGIGLSTLLLIIPLVVDEAEHKAILIGAVTQVRVLGGTVGLAVLAQVLNTHVQEELASLLPSEVVSEVLASVSAIAKLSTGEQTLVRTTFAEGYTLLMKIMAGLSGGVLLSSGLLWKRNLSNASQ